MMRLALSILLLAAFSAQAQTSTNYILAGGSGDGSSWSSPLDDLPATLQRNRTYMVGDGSYSSYTFDDAESSTQLIVVQKATPANHGTATGWSDTMGDGQATFGTLNFFTGYYTIDGVTGGGPGSWTSGHGFKINGHAYINPGFTSHTWENGDGDNVTLKHTEIDGTGESGTTAAVSIDFADGLHLSHLYTHNNAECFVRSLNSDNGLVEYCYVGEFCTDCSPAIHGEIFSWKYNGSLVARWNIFTWVESTGGIMIANTSADDVEVYGNVFYRAPGVTWTYGGDGVVGGWVGRTDLGVYNMKVYNNTFINIPDQALSPLGITPGNNRIVKNNYFDNSSTGLPSGSWDESYNHYNNSGSTSETGGTTSSIGSPFVSLSADNASAFLPTTPVGGDSIFPATYRTDWNGNVGTNKGAIQGDQGPDTTAPVLISATVDVYGTNIALVFNEPVRRGANYSDTNYFFVASATGAKVFTWTGTESNANWTGYIDEVINSGETVTLTIYQTNAAGNKIEDALGNDYAGITNFAVVNNSGEGQVATPTFSFASGNFYNPTPLELATVTSGADIYYTLDGTTPDATDTEYTGPFQLPPGTTVVKAIAIKSGSTDSGVATETYVVNTWVVATPAISIAIPNQGTNPITVRFDAVPNGGGVLFFTGLDTAAFNPSRALAGLSRLNDAGNVVEAFDDDAWTADASVTWSAGVNQAFTIVIDRVADTYDVTVNGLAVATDFALPADQLSETDYDYIIFYSSGGTTTVNNLRFGEESAPTPGSVSIGTVNVEELNVRQ